MLSDSSNPSGDHPQNLCSLLLVPRTPPFFSHQNPLQPSDPRHPSYSDGPSDSAWIPPLVICSPASPTGSLALSHIIRHVTLLRPNSLLGCVCTCLTALKTTAASRCPAGFGFMTLDLKCSLHLAGHPPNCSSSTPSIVPPCLSAQAPLAPPSHSLTPFLTRKPSCQNRMFSPHPAPGSLSGGTEWNRTAQAERTLLGQWEDGLFVPLAEDTFHKRT